MEESRSMAPSSSPQKSTQSYEGKMEKIIEKKKKKNSGSGSLPFYMFLEMDEVVPAVHPDCPNASNPYHKCVDYCLEKIQSSSKQFAHHRKGSKSKIELRDGVHPNCRYASNPYHKCVPRCYELMSLEEHAQTNSVGSRDGVIPSCIYASNPYHKCAPRCYKLMGLEEQPHEKSGFMVNEVDDSNSQYTARSSVPTNSRTNSLSSTDNDRATKGSKMEKNKKSWNLVPKLVRLTNESNVKQKKNKYLNLERWNVHPDCPNASNPFHSCVEECFKRINEMNQAKQARSKKGQEKNKMQTWPTLHNDSPPEHRSQEYLDKNKDVKDTRVFSEDSMDRLSKDAGSSSCSYAEHIDQEFLEKARIDEEKTCKLLSPSQIFMLGFIIILVYAVVRAIVGKNESENIKQADCKIEDLQYIHAVV